MSAGQPFGVPVAIDPNTGNPVVRTTPEHAIKNVYANDSGEVVIGIHGKANDCDPSG